MDSELLAYLEGQFASLREEIKIQTGSVRSELMEHTNQALASLRSELMEHTDQGLASFRSELKDFVREQADELRRHMGVIAEELRSEIKVIADGHLDLSRRIDELKQETRREFRELRTVLGLPVGDYLRD